MVLSLITTLFPIFGLELIIIEIFRKWNKDENLRLKKYIYPLAFIFGVYGYSMTFDNPCDLTRYFDIISDLFNKSIKWIFESDVEKLYIKDILFYFIEKTGNVHVLPFVVGFCIYAITFYVMFDMIERTKVKLNIGQIVMLSIICVGMAPVHGVIGNTRCVFSYILISFATYRDLVEKKRNIFTYLLYLAPIWLHQSAIILLIIRILSQLLKKVTKTSVIIAISLPAIIDITHSFISKISGGTIITVIINAVNRAYYYLHWTEGGWATSVRASITNNITRIGGSIFLISFILLIIFFNRKDDKGEKLIEKPMVSYMYLLSVFAVGCLYITTGAFWRFEAVVALFSSIVFINAFSLKNEFNKIFIAFKIIGMIMFIFNILYQIIELDASGTIINFVTTSGIKIIYELAKGIIKTFMFIGG